MNRPIWHVFAEMFKCFCVHICVCKHACLSMFYLSVNPALFPSWDHSNKEPEVPKIELLIN